jgi:3-oxoadipate enol-lactonase
MGRVAVTGALNYTLDGSGPCVVLLHPVGLDLTFLAPVARILCSEFTVLNVDQRGHGKSQASAPARSLVDYADDLHALLDTLSLAPAAIVGFSFGGMVAQELALKYPQDVSALVICASRASLPPAARGVARARGDDARKRGMADVLEATLDRWFTSAFRARGGAEASRARLLSDDVEGWAQAWSAMAAIDTLPRLANVSAPSLCLAGERDISSPPDAVKEMAAAIPGARYAELRGAPHMLFIEQPEETARIVGSFLRDVLKQGKHG